MYLTETRIFILRLFASVKHMQHKRCLRPTINNAKNRHFFEREKEKSAKQKERLKTLTERKRSERIPHIFQINDDIRNTVQVHSLIFMYIV